MKTVIAKRDKSVFYFFLVIVLVSLLINGFNIPKFLNSGLRWFGIMFIVVLSFITLTSLVCLLFLPNATIIKEDDNLIVYKGVFKKKIALKSVLSADLASLQIEKKESKNGNILLKIKTENGEEDLIIPQVKDKKKAVERLNELINGLI